LRRNSLSVFSFFLSALFLISILSCSSLSYISFFPSDYSSHSPQEVAVGIKQLTDKSAEVRLSAAKNMTLLAIAQEIDPELKVSMIDPLFNAFQDPDQKVRQSARYALAALTRSNISSDQKSRMFVQTTGLLNTKDPELRAEVIQLLGWFGYPRISAKIESELFKILVQELKNKDQWIRNKVCFAFDGLAQPEISLKIKSKIVPLMLRALKDKSRVVRVSATSPMRYLAMPTSEVSTKQKTMMLKSLVLALKDDYWSLRASAVYPLRDLLDSDISPDLKIMAINALFFNLGDQDLEVRKNAISSLGYIIYLNIPNRQKERIVAAAIKFAEDGNNKDVDIKRKTIWALQTIAGSGLSAQVRMQIVPSLSVFLKSDDEDIRSNAASALTTLFWSKIPLGDRFQIIKVILRYPRYFLLS